MRREHEVAPEATLSPQGRPELGEVTVLVPHGVGPEVIRDLAEQQLARGIPSSARDAGRGGGPDEAPALDQLARGRLRRGEDERGPRMPGEEPHQLLPDIPGGPEHAYGHG